MNSLGFVLRAASNYIPPFLKFIVGTADSAFSKHGKKKLQYLTKMLATQSIVYVKESELATEEAKLK